jgi:hypothetical protein
MLGIGLILTIRTSQSKSQARRREKMKTVMTLWIQSKLVWSRWLKNLNIRSISNESMV